MTTSLFSASTIPLVRRQARRYSCSSCNSRALVPASMAWVIWSAVVLASAISSASASLRQQVRSTAPTVLPEIGCVDRHPGAGQVLQILGVVLVTEHVRRLAALQRGADPVGADELLGVAEAGRQLDPVQVPLQVVVGGQPGEHHASGVGEDDADRLALEMLAQVPQHRHGAAGQRGVEVRVANIGQVDAVRSDIRPPGPPPGRQDRVAHLVRLDRLRGQEPFPGLRQPALSLVAQVHAGAARWRLPPYLPGRAPAYPKYAWCL